MGEALTPGPSPAWRGVSLGIWVVAVGWAWFVIWILDPSASLRMTWFGGGGPHTRPFSRVERGDFLVFRVICAHFWLVCIWWMGWVSGLVSGVWPPCPRLGCLFLSGFALVFGWFRVIPGFVLGRGSRLRGNDGLGRLEALSFNLMTPPDLSGFRLSPERRLGEVLCWCEVPDCAGTAGLLVG